LKKKYFILFFTTLSLYSFSQSSDSDDKRILYKKFFIGGVQLNSNGLGINTRLGTNPDIYWNRFYELDVVSMKHDKEIKIYHPFYDNVKGYVYGKKNAFIPIRFGYGVERSIASKKNNHSVAVQFLMSGGLSLGILKPVYLEILKEGAIPDTYYIVVEKYDPSQHRIDNIYGRASFANGLNEIFAMPGFYTKIAFNFDFSIKDERITTIETGAVFDSFFKEVPIMDSNENTNKFLTFYVEIAYGLKWNK